MMSGWLVRPKWRHKAEDSLAQRVRDAAPGATIDKRAEGGGLVCVRCGHTITHADAAMNVDGLHEYTQVNPGGYVWNFRCFSAAPGCRAHGAPSSEFTWFTGHRWQIENCAGCELHLGWRFESPDRTFHGLITERLVEASAGDGAN